MVKLNFEQATLACVVLFLVFISMGADVSGKSLVRPPKPPTPPTPGTRSLSNTNSTFGAPTCTTKDNFVGKQLGINQTTRNGVTNQQRRWITFYVHPDPAFVKWERDVINHAMWNLLQVLPCIRFGIYESSANPTGDYIRLVKGTNNGCNSYVGRQGGRQVINLQSPGCITVPTVMHELIHALGFYHEHCRPDRDDFISINWDNVIPEYKFAFNKQSTSDTRTYGVPYNYHSIMHYGNTAFSKNGQITLAAKDGRSSMGNKNELQAIDIQKLKAMYNC